MCRYLRMRLPKYDVRRPEYQQKEEINEFDEPVNDYGGDSYHMDFDQSLTRPEFQMTQFPGNLTQSICK